MSRNRTILLDSLIILCLASFLVKPLFRLKYLDKWPSIESTFIAEGRMLSEHLPHPAWQPLWYCGTRTDYIYPPALTYGTALISRFGHVLPARAYHLYTAVFYVLGIAAVYWMVRIGSGSRGAAWLAAAATALLSPSFLFLTAIRYDSGYWVPQRLHVLMDWGEGPHISALSILPAALAAAFSALRKWRPAALAGTAVLCALVVANNFYGATALAILFPMVVWAVWLGERGSGVWLRAAGIVVMSYGLSAFWLTPSYASITVLNLKWVSVPGNFLSLIVMLTVVALYAAFSWRCGTGRPEREWSVFVAGGAVVLSVYVLGFFYFGFRTAGEPGRLVPELDFALILAGVEIVRALWRRPPLRIASGFLVAIAFLPAVRYLRHVWSPFPKAAPVESVYEYKTTKWAHDHLPGERILPSGTVRFWFDAWYDNSQPDGGSMQGLSNQIIPTATWQITRGERADLAVLWLRALGTDAVIVPDRTSFEPYHDYSTAEKFRGALPVLHDDQHGTVIYGVPRLHPGIARIVDRAAMNGLGKIQGGDDAAGLAKYVSVVEDPAQPGATLAWRGFDEADIDAKPGRGQSVLVQETWDSAWHAYEDNKELPIRMEDKMGFMLIDTPEGDGKIEMRFETPLENRAGQVLFVLTGIVIIGLLTDMLLPAAFVRARQRRGW
jgi:hypothetical protein